MTNNENEIAFALPTSIRVLLPNNQVEEMKLETYLAGVIAAEIGLDAPLEALKAQAVASRTYAAAAQRHPEHNADVCTTAHCQKWKRVDPVAAPEIFRALSETWGIIATHDGQLINAFFFEHCDGHTRNAEEMHVDALAYLRGVDCSCGFLTLKGHGVGMCQRGAIVMARRNASFEQILQHYYRGVAIIRTGPEMPASELDESAFTPLPTESPVAPKPRTRARAAKSPADAALKPRRRVTRRVVTRPIEEPVMPPPVFEITAVPASVALKRVQITPTETDAGAPTPEPPVSAPTPSSEEKDAARLIVPGAPVGETTPVNEPAMPRLELDVPVRSSASQEPMLPQSEPIAEISWRLAKPEPIETTGDAPMPVTVADDTPSMIGRRVHVDHLPGERMICGALPRANVVVMIENSRGENAIVYSGTAPHYGEGGFELAVEDGEYIVTIGGQTINVQVQGDTVFIQA
jgi:hypothetical protein